MAESVGRVCEVDGCGRPHRARGLCSTCYNQQHQPNRHRPVTVPCEWCGKDCEKSRTRRFTERFCSYGCRDNMRAFRSTPDHPRLVEHLTIWHRAHPDFRPPLPVLWRPPPPPRPPRRTFVAGNCWDCGVTFLAESYTGEARYCSEKCLKRRWRRARKARAHGSQGMYTWTEVMRLFILFDRRCAYCAEPIEGQPDPDHVVPLARGGHNGLGNILPACRDCNCDKRDVSLDEWNEDRLRRGLPLRITTWRPGDPRYRHLNAQAAQIGVR